MRVLRLDIKNFRGLHDITVHPRDHVVLAGEPRAGRTTVAEALRRALAPDASRLPLTDDLDFYRRDRSLRIEVEVVLGALSEALEQEFFDYLEPWDPQAGSVVTETPDPTDLDEDDVAFAVRLCYRAEWDHDAEVGQHWVDFPKVSDPNTGHFTRVPRRMLEMLPFVFVDADRRPLGLGVRSPFRRLVEQMDGDDFSDAVEGLIDQVETGSEAFSETEQVSAAIDLVLAPVRRSLGIGARRGSEIVNFLPEGGSLSGMLRSLTPSLALSKALRLPLARQGATTFELLRMAEALALGDDGDAVVVVDDFGEGLDASAALHLAATYRSTFRQVWISTRRGAIGEAFRPDELVRLIRPRKGTARVHQGTRPTSKAERVAARHLSLQIFPSIASRTVAVLEGPHDRAGLSAVALRRLQSGEPLPAAYGVTLTDAGAADRSGGAGAAVKLARFASELGFRVVVVLDGDRAGDEVEASAEEVAAAVVRLPKRQAIERALVDGIDSSHVRKAVRGLGLAFGATVPTDIDGATDDELKRIACEVIKSAGGLHSQFVELLPGGIIPPVAARVLDAICDAATGRISGVIEL